MTKKPISGTLSTRSNSDKKPKEPDVFGKMKRLLGENKVRFLLHANERMGQRNIIYFEVLQALSNGRHEPKRDRYCPRHQAWEYSVEGRTVDERCLRIGISFETNARGERLLIVTVIEPGI